MLCATRFPPLATCLWCPFSARHPPHLVQCEGKACGVGVTGPMERASHFPGKGGLEGGGGLEVAEGKPVGW